MFIELKVKDSVRIIPKSFNKDLKLAVEDELHAKYVNKVITNHGLCICIRAIDHLSEAKIYHGDGSAYIRVSFRLVLFKPYINEVLIGKIERSSQKSIQISIGFFDSIIIPAENLLENTFWNDKSKLFYFNWEGHHLDMENQEEIVFRVTDVQFKTSKPPQNKNSNNFIIPNENNNDTNTTNSNDIQSAMTIIGTVNEKGLGLTSWW